MNTLQAALLTLFPALVIIAALTDATSFTIPNRISLLLLAAYVPASLLLGRPMADMGIDLAVGVAALIAGMAMFAAGWIGGGDAKMFAACALWLGLRGAPSFLMVTAMAGGGLAVLLLNARSASFQTYFAGAPRPAPWRRFRRVDWWPPSMANFNEIQSRLSASLTMRRSRSNRPNRDS